MDNIDLDNNEITESIAREYFIHYDKYEKLYGKNKTYVLIQIGKFYESFCTDEDGPNLKEIHKKINVAVTNTNKKGTELTEEGEIKVTKDHPYKLGFPVSRLFNFIEPLIEEGYNVITIDQVGFKLQNNKKVVERKTTGIYSMGTYIENISSSDTKYIAVIFIAEERQQNGSMLLSAGMSAVDLSTSKSYIHEAYSTSTDTTFSLDEISRFITTLQPKELFIYYEKSKKNSKYDNSFILEYLDLSGIEIVNIIDPSFFKINYQNEILNKVYNKEKSMISPIELLDIANNTYIIISFCILLDYVYKKNETLLKNLPYPIFYMNKKHFILGNNAINQLNIIGNSEKTTKQFKNLFDVVNNTSTPMGERYLKSLLLSPLININQLNKSYDLIDEMINNNLYKIVEKYLGSIYDIERMECRISLGILKPNEIILMLKSYKNILALIEEINKYNENKFLKLTIPDEEDIDKIKKIINNINRHFNLTELGKYVTLEFKTSIFNQGIHEDIDQLSTNINKGYEMIEKLNDALIKILDIGSVKNPSIKIKNNPKEGYYLFLTNTRAKILKEKLKQIEFIKLDDDTNIDINNLIFTEHLNNTKIYFNNKNNKNVKKDNSNVLFTAHDNMKNFTEEIERLTKKHYLEYLQKFYDKYINIFEVCNKFITKLDFIKSAAKTSKLYNFTRPKLVDKEYGYINAVNLRHPIVERIINFDYVPHDVKIGNDELKGMLVYGLNSSGKSVFMKAVAIAVILAQSGLFVPADSCTISPYSSLYARITGNDNLTKGLSSFGVEILELEAILKRADKKMLIVGDEICRGTEHISATSIVASAVMNFSKIGSTFICTTHLHEMSELDEITSLKNVKMVHLHAEYDPVKDVIVYDRKLKEGPGEKIYGLMVAKTIIKDPEFILNANKIKNKLMKENDSLVSNKTSRYNNNVIVNECQICGMTDKTYHISPLETHHINFQRDCDDDDFVKDKKYIKKNQESNLIILCNKCHDKIHSGKLKVNGYVMTSKGRSVVVEES